MAHRIQIISKTPDTRAVVRKRYLDGIGFKNKIKDLKIIDVFTIDKDLNKKQISSISSLLINPVTQESSENFTSFKFNWAIEIGFLPGVTDNIASTTKELIEDLNLKFKLSEGVYTSQITFLSGNLSKKDVDKIAESLYNPLIQRASIKTFEKFQKNNGMDIIVPKVKLNQNFQVEEVNLNINDEELIQIGKKGIANKDGTRRGPLALDLISLQEIQKYFKKLKRKPTDIELETIAQTWSEHCKHTIFANSIDNISKGLFKTHIKAATEKIRKLKGKKDFCVSVFSDNSGAIIFDKNYLITHKVETHNSPSALDPFGGSITGIVGVNRDTIGFGLGAKPIANVYGFCLANPNDKTVLYRNSELTRKILSPRRIMDGVIDGVNSGGNQSGIPTPQGFLYFNDGYKGKPLVFCGTVGLIPKFINKKNSCVKKAKSGDLIVMVGGRVGQDGIHGATFSSEALDTGSPATAVQIGDPITQKKMSDAIIKEARDMNLYNSITDDGAGGLSSSVAEMAKESNGCLVELDKVPLKYPGLEPWQIWISESQERMTLAIPPQKWPKFFKLMKKRGVESTVIGKFTNSGKCIAKYKGQIILDLEMEFLHNGLPSKKLKTEEIKQTSKKIQIPEKTNLTNSLVSILSQLNIASFEFLSSQYDHEVQGSSVLKPLQGRGRINADTTAIKPVLDSPKGVILSHGLYPTYSSIDSYSMAACSIDTAIRNAVTAGANPDSLALLDNFCWCDSNNPQRLWQLKNATLACHDFSIKYQTPFISGKDSMFNDFVGFDSNGKSLKISIPPTLLISSIGVIDDVTKLVSLDVKFPGDLVYILGETFDELGGSEYCDGNKVPTVDAIKNKKLYTDYYKCIKKGVISSAISVNRGGLAVALAKKTMGGLLGMKINLKNLPGKTSRSDFALFSESQGRIVITISPTKQKIFEKIMKNNSIAQIGEVTQNDDFIINGLKGKEVVKTNIKSMLDSYKSTFKEY